MGTLITAIADARMRERTAQRDWQQTNDELVATQRKLDRAERHGYASRVALNELTEKLTAQREQYAVALNTAHAERIAAERALDDVRGARWAERTTWLRTRVEVACGADEPNYRDDVLLDAHHGDWLGIGVTGTYTLSLTETRPVNDGSVTFMSRFKRFGFEVTVYAPHLAYDFDARDTRDAPAAHVWKPAQVNWGSMGAMSVEQARDMLRLHSAAVALAELLNEQRDAWYAEDMAD